ncbi:PilN domain-containing protein [Stieleria sp. ICT_E10.1]|uniref:PilN domain-containing protein n=1 Tax=Stieleria sedimenti TaxID=2976331 RepID=UPI00217FDBDE|nr:PilN domain-containing protein [Stieleria sedimenti]MCS7465448.1 PilN domain-containing protein [Stieleria sedimenti]
MASTLQTDLLKAADREPATLERRQSPRRRVRRDRRKGVSRTVGMDVSPSGIAIAVVEKSGGESKLIVERIAFPADSGPRQGDWSDSTLTDALNELASKYNLGGQAVTVGLGGNPCVTRVVAGDNEEVDNEIRELTHRTQRYIGMGLGSKVSCQSTHRIDAKRKRVCVTIAIRQMVDAIAAAVQSAGMRLAHLEHSMLVLCRILHAYEKDSQVPVLFMVEELGRVDLGISYQGRLLLDYRPAIPEASVTHGSIVQRHLKCLRRYIHAQLPTASADLSTLFVTQTHSDHESLDQSLDEPSILGRQRFPMEELCEGFQVQGELSEDSGTIAAIGLARLNNDARFAEETNDLVSTLRTGRRVQWVPLIQYTWPITLAASIALALFLIGQHTRRLAHRTEAQIETLTLQNAQGNRIRLTLQRRMQRAEQVDALAAGIPTRDWADVFLTAGRSLPQGSWLESVRIENDETVRISGASYSGEAVYTYIDRLKQTGMFLHVALESTSATRNSVGAQYRFQVSAIVQPKQQPKSSSRVASTTAGGLDRG